MSYWFTYLCGSFDPSIHRHSGSDKNHLYFHKIHHFDKGLIGIRFYLQFQLRIKENNFDYS